MTATFTPRADLIQVTYRYLSPKLIDPEKKAKAIALGQTTGTWTPREKSRMKKFRQLQGVVLGIDEKTHKEGHDYEYWLSVGFPPGNTDGDIPSLLTMIFGKVSLDGKIRLEQIFFPDSYLNGKGPRHGIAGIRERVGEPIKPLAMAILKPSVGPTPAELAETFYQLAAGGMHLVKDDETLTDLSVCPTEKRLEACLKAAERAKQQTGKLTLYAVNLTGRPSQIVKWARKLAGLGAHCFLLNVLPYGYGVLEELHDVGVPILAQPALAGALGGARDTGISYSILLGSLMRLGGADIVLFPSSYGPLALPEKEAAQIRKALVNPLGTLLPSFPAPTTGIHPGLLPRLLQDYGLDFIINAGKAVHNHPHGGAGGAKAFRQAIDWVLKRRNFGGVSEREFPELAQALKLWGKGL